MLVTEALKYLKLLKVLKYYKREKGFTKTKIFTDNDNKKIVRLFVFVPLR